MKLFNICFLIFCIWLLAGSFLQAQESMTSKEAYEHVERAMDEMNGALAQVEIEDQEAVKLMHLKMKAYQSIQVDLLNHFSFEDCIERAVIHCGEGTIDEEDYRTDNLAEPLEKLRKHLNQLFKKPE